MDFVVVPAEFSLGHNRRMQMAWHLPAPSRASNSLPSMSSLMKSIAIQCDQHHRLSKGWLQVGRLIIADFDRYRDIWVYYCADFAIEGKGVTSRREETHHMSARRLAVTFVLCVSALHASHNAAAQKRIDVEKSSYH